MAETVGAPDALLVTRPRTITPDALSGTSQVSVGRIGLAVAKDFQFVSYVRVFAHQPDQGAACSFGLLRPAPTARASAGSANLERKHLARHVERHSRFSNRLRGRPLLVACWVHQPGTAFLHTRLSKCGVCGAAFIMAGRNRLACFGAREKGTCDSCLTIRRDGVEARVLKALEEKLLRQELFDESCEESTREMNRSGWSIARACRLQRRDRTGRRPAQEADRDGDGGRRAIGGEGRAEREPSGFGVRLGRS
jgi:hypothetical protein